MKINKILKMSIYILPVFFSIGIILPIHAQDKIIPLWTDAIPGAIKAADYQEKEIYKEGKVQSISKVVTPTLSVFLAAEGNSNGSSVLILPGGGYSHLSIDKEGTKVAHWLNSLGITAIVLKYRLPSDQIMKDKTIGPLQDAQEAIRYIRRNAEKWNLNKDKIGVIGFSAGGHLAATLSTHYNDTIYLVSDSVSAKPDFSILIYPVISMNNEITHKGSQNTLLGVSPSVSLIDKFSNEQHVNSETPPTFIIHATDDLVVRIENSINYHIALKKNKVPTELHLYEKGGHGFGLGVKDTSQYWTKDCENWLRIQLFLN
ncbi:alpha/beta hydrolase [Flavobacterium sinopsychrotolerans]|uniref:Acetyl esterase/lipase n=1 Tax=Flavobacterium sinopsychrotolerans TaxID=604089 RepID=A0A1H8I8Y8_9FLAO|nr:alpha/beta hydrolase [Flavobacterium sinopsychrotolerans]SEN64615.1 Acetyl esterase/lipase [Flavobacterium sinopsychrotolerans]